MLVSTMAPFSPSCEQVCWLAYRSGAVRVRLIFASADCVWCYTVANGRHFTQRASLSACYCNAPALPACNARSLDTSGNIWRWKLHVSCCVVGGLWHSTAQYAIASPDLLGSWTASVNLRHWWQCLTRTAEKERVASAAFQCSVAWLMHARPQLLLRCAECSHAASHLQLLSATTSNIRGGTDHGYCWPWRRQRHKVDCRDVVDSSWSAERRRGWHKSYPWHYDAALCPCRRAMTHLLSAWQRSQRLGRSRICCSWHLSKRRRLSSPADCHAAAAVTPSNSDSCAEADSPATSPQPKRSRRESTSVAMSNPHWDVSCSNQGKSIRGSVVVGQTTPWSRWTICWSCPSTGIRGICQS